MAFKSASKPLSFPVFAAILLLACVSLLACASPIPTALPSTVKIHGSYDGHHRTSIINGPYNAPPPPG
ncbi:hypothetical protein M405DRAFT_812994 [Rhizopogon salebrosus TDB-379]|nr:hypothetical protein M405DRAFT_812994 [Rhizopogon salebrosus TDB-379]